MKSIQDCFYNLSHSSDKWNSYFSVYEKHLKHLKDTNITLVEVGVQKGGSLEMWSNYFGPQSKIIGIDIDEECSKLTYSEKNIQVVIGDQGNPKFWDSFLKLHPTINVFIDDAGHYMKPQILTFEKVFPIMPVGSIYICEDCHTSYSSYNGGGLRNPNSFIEYSKGFVDVLNYSWKETTSNELEHQNKIAKDLTSVCFYNSMVVFEKNGKENMKRVFPDQFSNKKDNE